MDYVVLRSTFSCHSTLLYLAPRIDSAHKRKQQQLRDKKREHGKTTDNRAADMASMVMTASSFPNGSAMTVAKPTASRRGLIVAKASAGSEAEKVNLQMRKSKEESSSGRRDLMLAVAAAAACSVAKIAMADEPKRGTEEAKKKYAVVCVTMPTARICHK